MAVSWRRVNSTRNSYCGSCHMKQLDFTEWWMDTFDLEKSQWCYIHVASKDNETVHRVRCKYSDKPRLGYRNGALYWLIDRKEYDRPTHTT